jgi:hypothetical protein
MKGYKNDQYVTRTIAISHGLDGEGLASGQATSITITDDGCGEYVRVAQGGGQVGITPEEWPSLQRAISTMIEKCAVEE